MHVSVAANHHENVPSSGIVHHLSGPNTLRHTGENQAIQQKSETKRHKKRNKPNNVPSSSSFRSPDHDGLAGNQRHDDQNERQTCAKMRCGVMRCNVLCTVGVVSVSCVMCELCCVWCVVCGVWLCIVFVVCCMCVVLCYICSKTLRK